MNSKRSMLALVVATALGLGILATLAVTNGSAGQTSAAQSCAARGPYVGESARDLTRATHAAAMQAVKKSRGACKGTMFEVQKIELLLENPHVREYKVTIRPGG